MAQYGTHVATNILIGLPLAMWGLVVYFNPPPELAGTFAGAYLYATLFLSPDLDLANQVKLLSLKGLLTLPFRLYAFLFRHRGMSHWPIIGTATRLAFVGALGALALFFYDPALLDYSLFEALFRSHELYVYYGISGIVLSDFCHLVVDFLT